MNTRSPASAFCGLAALLLLNGCALRPAATPSAVLDNPPPLEVEGDPSYHILAGEMAAGRGQPGVAATEFLKVLETVPDAGLAARATQLAIAANDEALALRAAFRWQALEPGALEAREILARLLLRSGDLAGTIMQCATIISGHAGGVADGFRHVGQLLGTARVDEQDAALTVMGSLVAQWPQNADAYHALGLMALRFDRLEAAARAALQAMQLDPADHEHELLLAGVQVRQQQFREATERVETLLRSNATARANTAAIRQGFGRLLLDAGLRDEARQQMRLALRHDPDYADARYALAVMATTDRDYAEAERLLLPLLKTERAQEAGLQLGRIAENRGDLEQALAYYSAILRGATGLDATLRRAHVLARLERVDEGREIMRQLRYQLPQLSPRFFVAEGEMLLEAGRPGEALDLYSSALDDYPDDPDLRYGRSLAYERLGRIDAAEADLRSLLRRDPDDARALNALGYMLTVHTRRYAEAKSLVSRALALQPEDAAVIDSMGWVHFKLGEPRLALDWLERAYAKFPDPEVAAHLGEVLWTLGEQDRARQIWDEALARDPAHPALKETVERLRP